MRLVIATPTRIVVDREVTAVQAEDATGRFGLREGHERFLTSVVPSILIYRFEENGAERERFVAVRQGVLRVGKGVRVAVREAHESEDMSELQEMIRKARAAAAGAAQRMRRSLYQMQIASWRRLMEYEDARTRQG